jgi:hypothetical protein
MVVEEEEEEEEGAEVQINIRDNCANCSRIELRNRRPIGGGPLPSPTAKLSGGLADYSAKSDAQQIRRSPSCS